MAKHYYRVPIESDTGAKISIFWQNCNRVNRLADKYAKRMGGQYYHNDPRYMAGGVVCLSFPNNQPNDPKMWKAVATESADGTIRFPDGKIMQANGTTTLSKYGYLGPTKPGDIEYFEPNVTKEVEYVEIPDKEYRPRNTFDHIYNDTPIERDGKLFLQCLHFVYSEPPGHSWSQPGELRVASNTVRRAIKAELQRMKLPVVRAETLLDIIQAEWRPKKDASHMVTIVTPTFFAYREYYYIGCDYGCTNPDLQSIVPELYKDIQSRLESELES